ncbi:MAG: RNA-directed DNA polymerase [Sulfurovum sp.]|nr:RNA-directed DNA polymerase [Sulfurovum sp.]
MDLFTQEQENNNDALLLGLFEAYRDTRKNKRDKRTQVAFEFDHEKKLIRLHKNIVNKRYKPLRSTAFISTKPVIREVFAAHFQDRIVHHLIFKHLSPVFEQLFIEDSYSCRKGKGTLYGVNRMYNYIDECSEHYSTDAYVLKLDIQGYFYSINKDILYATIKKRLVEEKASLVMDLETLDYLIKSTIYSEPTKNVKIYKDDKNWNMLPKTKSLFYAKEGYGLPIGNLTSQLFSNIYMHVFDEYVTKELGVKYYGRYVDDFVLVHNDKAYLLSLIKKIRVFLKEKLHLVLHPKKIYLQHFSKGLVFLGAYMKPYVKYVERRCKTSFYALVEQINRELKENVPSDDSLHRMRSSVNSYLGTLVHFSSFKLRKKILRGLDDMFYHYFMLDKDFSKVVLKQYY